MVDTCKISCPKCNRELIMKKGKKPKCPYCKGAWFTKGRRKVKSNHNQFGKKYYPTRLGDVVNKSVETVENVI